LKTGSLTCRVVDVNNINVFKKRLGKFFTVSGHSFCNPRKICDNNRVSGALEKLEHETILQDRASDR